MSRVSLTKDIPNLWNFARAASAIEADANMAEFPASDGELLRRFRAGDRDAFTVLYRAHQAGVFRFAMLMTGDHAKATEVTQDVFVWLIHHAANFDPARGELRAFLAGVTRKFLLRQRTEALRWAPLDENVAGNFVPAASAAQASDSDALRRAVLALPDKYREVVVRCDLEEKSYEEAAELIGCAVGTVRSRLHRARLLLARKLVQQGGRRIAKCPA